MTKTAASILNAQISSMTESALAMTLRVLHPFALNSLHLPENQRAGLVKIKAQVSNQ